ncbi:MAG: DNA repair protein RadA [Clostridiales bacterium]|nr:DNA repair protein RadA [Clostridiales bacterium]
MKEKTLFLCSNCGYESSKWYGKCPACSEWNTLKEEKQLIKPLTNSRIAFHKGGKPEPVLINEVQTDNEIRIQTGISEMDRVLGGGAVTGSLILLSGEPGIGKSTLLMQVCRCLSEKNIKILYVSGEESLKQLKLRSERIGTGNGLLYVMAETELDEILLVSGKILPDILIVDSIQTTFRASIDSTPGSVTQVKECTLSLMQYAKGSGATVFIVGHVNKDGAIAGPKVLEHMVDCVLYFEGERHNSYRMLRAEKNRFGSTYEIGVFEMGGGGLTEVSNPSAALLSGRPKSVFGSCVACTMEGSRPIMAEIQGLVAKSAYGTPRRMSAGIDYNRAVLMLAVLEKRAGLLLGACDTYINVIGGLKLDEPAIDLPVALAVASSFLEKPIDDACAAFGEIGLTGELRAVFALQQRINEINRLGFSKCIMPYQDTSNCIVPSGLELIKVRSIREAIDAIL